MLSKINICCTRLYYSIRHSLMMTVTHAGHLNPRYHANGHIHVHFEPKKIISRFCFFGFADEVNVCIFLKRKKWTEQNQRVTNDPKSTVFTTKVLQITPTLLISLSLTDISHYMREQKAKADASHFFLKCFHTTGANLRSVESCVPASFSFFKVCNCVCVCVVQTHSWASEQSSTRASLAKPSQGWLGQVRGWVWHDGSRHSPTKHVRMEKIQRKCSAAEKMRACLR